MIDYHDLDILFNFQQGEYFITTLYLDVDRKRVSKKESEIKLKALIKERKSEIEALGLSSEVEASLLKDFEKLVTHVTLEMTDVDAKTIAAFTCSAKGLWRIYPLHLSVHPRLVVSKQPYIRPLRSILAENKRYFIILISKDRARLFEQSMGTLVEHSEILDEIPHSTKQAGWYGLKERRIQRHINDHIHRHFKHVAETSLNFLQTNHYDNVITCGRKEILPDFERHLNSNIRRKIVSRINLDPGIPTSDLSPLLSTKIQENENENQRRLIESLFAEKATGGLAAVGLQATLETLYRGQASTLFVTEDFSFPGFYCPECWYLNAKAGKCPVDQLELKPSHDIIEDAIETAIYQNCEIVRVKNPGLLRDVENIGASLRFKL